MQGRLLNSSTEYAKKALLLDDTQDTVEHKHRLVKL